MYFIIEVMISITTLIAKTFSCLIENIPNQEDISLLFENDQKLENHCDHFFYKDHQQVITLCLVFSSINTNEGDKREKKILLSKEW